MNQCSQACSSAMRVAGGMQVELAHGRAAGQVVDRMGRRAERAQRRAAVKPTCWKCSSWFSLALASNQTAAPSPALPSGAFAQRPSDLLRQHRPQFRSQVAPHVDPPALPRQLDQRPVRHAGLDPNPLAVELRALQVPGALQLDHQLRPRSEIVSPSVGMPRIRQERRSDRRQLEPGKRQGSAPPPETRRTSQSRATRRTARHTASPTGPASPNSCAARTSGCSGPAPWRNERRGFDTGDAQKMNLRIVARGYETRPAHCPASRSRCIGTLRHQRAAIAALDLARTLVGLQHGAHVLQRNGALVAHPHAAGAASRHGRR